MLYFSHVESLVDLTVLKNKHVPRSLYSSVQTFLLLPLPLHSFSISAGSQEYARVIDPKFIYVYSEETSGKGPVMFPLGRLGLGNASRVVSVNILRACILAYSQESKIVHCSR